MNKAKKLTISPDLQITAYIDQGCLGGQFLVGGQLLDWRQVDLKPALPDVTAEEELLVQTRACKGGELGGRFTSYDADTSKDGRRWQNSFRSWKRHRKAQNGNGGKMTRREASEAKRAAMFAGV